jgi:hypothetical protein
MIRQESVGGRFEPDGSFRGDPLALVPTKQGTFIMKTKDRKAMPSIVPLGYPAALGVAVLDPIDPAVAL